MIKHIERVQQFPWFLWLIGSYPICYLYAQNISQVDRRTVIEVWAVTMLTISAAFFGLRYLLGNQVKAAVMVGIATAGFFTYGHFYNVFAEQLDHRPSHLVLIVIFGLLLAGLMALVLRYPQAMQGIIRYLNIVGVVLIIFPAISILSFQVRRVEGVEINLRDDVRQDRTDPEEFPDIYYIILDTYGREDWLLDQFGYDNSEFINALRERGFYVADRSCTNYNTTVTSVSSALAMSYHDVRGLEDWDRRRGESYLVSFAGVNNQAADLAQELGYTYIHFSSGFLITNHNQQADVVMDFGSKGSFVVEGEYRVDFMDVFLPTTMLRPVYQQLSSRVYSRYAMYSPDRVLAQFRELRHVPEIKEPTFTVAHFLSPHFPYVFDRRGGRVRKPVGWIPEDDINAPNRRRLYIDQLMYINTKVLNTVDYILEHSETRPIIIIQGDHNLGNDNDYGFPILNAYLVPLETWANLYPAITPVNSFRLLYDTYWGLDLGLLEEHHYYHLDKNHPFHIRDANEDELAWCD